MLILTVDDSHKEMFRAVLSSALENCRQMKDVPIKHFLLTGVIMRLSKVVGAKVDIYGSYLNITSRFLGHMYIDEDYTPKEVIDWYLKQLDFIRSVGSIKVEKTNWEALEKVYGQISHSKCTFSTDGSNVERASRQAQMP